jgi:ABC-type transport system substrate-binding protein
MFGRRWLFFGLIIALSAVLVACSGNDGTDASKAGSKGGEETVHRGGTLIVAMDQAPVADRFDPMKSSDLYTSTVVNAVTEGLVKYNEKLEPEPWLAERYETSSDGLVYTFYLRKGIKFHDGTEMDSEAVKFSVDRVRDEKNKQWPRYSDSQFIADTGVVDKYTFKIVLKEASAAFPSRLTGGLGGVISPTALRTMGEEAFGRAPVGTGPFKFREYKADNYVRLDRFDGYWRSGADGQPLPYVNNVEWRIITEPGNQLLALQSGDIHVLSTIRDEDVKLVKADPNIVYAQAPGLTFTGFHFNLSVAPFNNKALRQAVQYAIDRDEIVKAVYDGNRQVGYFPVAILNEWATDSNYKPYSFDQAKARQKLVEGGRPDGFEFTAWIAAGNSTMQQLYELIQAQLAKVGIRMKIEAADFNGVVTAKWQRNDPDGHAYAIGWGAGVDPDQLLTTLFTKGGSRNYTKYENPRYDELIAAARTTSDREARARNYREALKVLMEDSPYEVLTYAVDRHVGTKKVKGWYVGTKATTSYSEYWLSD